MTKPMILMTRKVPEPAMVLLRGHCRLKVWEGEDPAPRAWLVDHLPEAEGLYCLLTDRIDVDLLASAPRLRVISTMAVGFDHIDVRACTERSIPIGNTPGVLTETTADFAFALIMAAARRVCEGVDYVRQGRWRTWSPTLLLGQDLYGASLGIIGYGRIGKAVAKRATGFSMEVRVCTSSPPKFHAGSLDSLGHRIHLVDLEALLKHSDFVTLHVPLTEATRHLIGPRELALMKPTAVLVNTSRGAVVDQHALFQALSSGRIASAALDVTDPEPIPHDDPLLRLPNCLIVPHIASASVATRTRMAMMAADNLLAGLSNQRLPHCVNPEVYDRGGSGEIG